MSTHVRIGSHIASVGFIIPDNPDECWLWTGSVDSNGYAQGYSRHLGRVEKAHRIIWAMLHGPAPRRRYGKELDHTCKTRRCVNPAHMELVTVAVNRARRDMSHLRRPVTHGTLTGYYARRCRCEPCRTVAREYQRERRYRGRCEEALALVTHPYYTPS